MDIFINEEDEKNSVLLRDDMINTYAKGRIAMVYVTDRAKFLASHICDEMHKKCHSDDNIDIIDIKTFRLDVKSCFLKYDLIIFIMATGIAVRTIAPYLVDKYIDPAVLVIDDMGNNVISLLGGHMAGANEYAKFIAEKIGAEAIITTATDINKKGAFDLLVKRIGAKLENLRELSLKYNVELLNDMGPYLFVDPDIEGLVKSIPRWGDVTRGFRDYKLHLMADRSEEHTSELQSRQYLVCRLLLEKKKTYFSLFSPPITTLPFPMPTSSSYSFPSSFFPFSCFLCPIVFRPTCCSCSPCSTFPSCSS